MMNVADECVVSRSLFASTSRVLMDLEAGLHLLCAKFLVADLFAEL